MAFTDDDEILQDFIVEAGEILEQLGEQLVELENQPRDQELLNAVFRGFHTVKGGAGFLNITNLVAICHRAEDVFNVLRQGARTVDSALMDVILKVHDEVNSMFACVRRLEEPPPADPDLLRQLERYSVPDDAGSGNKHAVASAQAAAPAEPVSPETAAEVGPDQEGGIADAQFDGKPSQGGEPPSEATPATAEKEPEEISDEEFEALLDQLHGAGGAPGAKQETPRRETVAQATGKPAAGAAGGIGAVSKPAARKEAAQPQAETTVRVDTKRLDDIMNLVGELVLVRNRLATLEATNTDEEMAKAVANLDLVTADLQTSVMKTRMQPIKKVFGRFPRVVRDLARSLHKEVSLELIGEETDLDKNLVEALADPLVHLVRNAVDHGIEMPDERERLGKNRVGTIVLSAEQEGDHILLAIRDDGAGMDPNKLRAKAVEKGLMDSDTAERLSDQECYQLIFMAGFSTKSEISDVSGRGVGMDVVKTKITQLNGSLRIESQSGKGSQIYIKVPLTLAIMPTLMVKIGSQIFALPLGSVVEIFHLDLSQTKVVDGQEVVLIREKALPIFYLRRWLVHGDERQDKTSKGHVVVVHAGSRQVGFVVDKLLGQEEVVIKPLGASLHGISGLAGATITGDGRISLILDVPGMMAKYASKTQGYGHDGQCISG